jgi:chemotaxis protein CheD
LKFNQQFARPEHYIGPGDYYSSGDDIVISTLLGSCIAVALYDTNLPMGGLNHFMLPFPKVQSDSLFSNSAKYGVHAMEVLINDMLKKGCRKEKLRAKVFGGSTVISYAQEATYNIPRMNIDFIFRFLETERIPVDSYSVGGARPRKIFFFPVTAKVLMKYSKAEDTGLAHHENLYSLKILEETENAGKPVLF